MEDAMTDLPISDLPISGESALGGLAMAIAGAGIKGFFDYMSKRGPNRQKEVNEFLQRLQDELDSTRDRLDKVEARNDALSRENHELSLRVTTYESQVITLRTERDMLLGRVQRMEEKIRELEHE
jgi:predicted RNase H-like nuclease (RuvC/YqgF family)